MQTAIQLEKPNLGNEDILGTGKIRLGEYPYTYARVTVMRTLLIKPEQYDRLLKMSLLEIIRYLEETEYKKEIDQFALAYSGVDLVEQALNKNIVKTFEKLRKISNGALLELINIFLMRKDIHNLKSILRGKFTKTSSAQIEPILVPAGMLNMAVLSSLIKLDNIEEIFRHRSVCEVVPFNYLKSYLGKLKQDNDIAKLENALDKYYFKSLLNFVLRLSDQGEVFREFISTELDMLNIMTILRLKKEGMPNNEIKKFLISSDDNREQRKIDYLLKVHDIDSIIERLKKLGYSNILKSGIDEYKVSGSLIEIEMAFKRHLLHKTLLFEHKNPLSIDTILSFMFAKDMEIRNLLILIKCKQFGFDEDFIRKQLVI